MLNRPIRNICNSYVIFCSNIKNGHIDYVYISYIISSIDLQNDGFGHFDNYDHISYDGQHKPKKTIHETDSIVK